MAEPAVIDLKQIARYVSKELREPLIAQKLVGRIKETVMSLSNLPTRHALVEDKRLAILGIRKLTVDNYIIFYIVSENDSTVTIVRVLYGRRNWLNLL